MGALNGVALINLLNNEFPFCHTTFYRIFCDILAIMHEHIMATKKECFDRFADLN